MKLPLRFSDRANDDVALAAKWYRERSAGLDRRFIAELADHLATIAAFPNGAIRISKSLRQLPMTRFPYVIVYRPARNWVTITRVIHVRRHPQERLRPH